MKEILSRIAKLIDFKSILTAALTFGLLMMAAGCWKPDEVTFTLYASTYGSMTAFFFSKKKDGEEK